MGFIKQNPYEHKCNYEILHILINCKITHFTFPPDLFALEKKTGTEFFQ